MLNYYNGISMNNLFNEYWIFHHHDQKWYLYHKDLRSALREHLSGTVILQVWITHSLQIHSFPPETRRVWGKLQIHKRKDRFIRAIPCAPKETFHPRDTDGPSLFSKRSYLKILTARLERVDASKGTLENYPRLPLCIFAQIFVHLLPFLAPLPQCGARGERDHANGMFSLRSYVNLRITISRRFSLGKHD